jgi:hypothetical protein
MASPTMRRLGDAFALDAPAALTAVMHESKAVEAISPASNRPPLTVLFRQSLPTSNEETAAVVGLMRVRLSRRKELCPNTGHQYRGVRRTRLDTV